MIEKDNNFNIPIHEVKNSSLSDCNFDSFSKKEVIDKYETVLISREKQIKDLSELIGNYSDKLATAYERIKFLEEENEKNLQKLKKKDILIKQEQETKEIMFLRLKAVESELDSLHQSSQNERKGPIDSLFNFFTRGRSKSDAISNNIEKQAFDNFNTTHDSLNIEALSTKPNEEDEKESREEPENIINKQPKFFEEEALDKEKNDKEHINVFEKIKALKKRKLVGGGIKEDSEINDGSKKEENIQLNGN